MHVVGGEGDPVPSILTDTATQFNTELLVPKVQLGNTLDTKLCLVTQRLVFVLLLQKMRRGIYMSEVVFDENHEAELLGECVPKPELGNEDV